MSSFKYDLSTLTWQEFEVLAFQCLQFEISRSLQFIEGGNDKGRDFVFNGTTSFFNVELEKKYLFQAKHKTGINGFGVLKSDLLVELEKVFIKHRHPYDFYCLVTNLSLTGNQFDELQNIFDQFMIDEGLVSNGVKFGIFSYRHFESIIDKQDTIRWNFPSIVKYSDFKLLMREFLSRTDKVLVNTWLKLFEKNKDRFVYTSIYEAALEKLGLENVLLLSGPPKSGKTFTAEMIMFNCVCSQAFVPYQIDHIEDFFKLFDKDERQIFLFDDSFGRHNLDLYRADSIDRKFEIIFELIDDRHKCVFTSREHIVRSFLNYSSREFEEYIERVLVETSKLSNNEKESIFKRYFRLGFPEDNVPPDSTITAIVNHKNFSPETIRSYFEDRTHFDIFEFQEHLARPDKYLEKVFVNLTEEKRVVLLSLLFAINENIQTISYSFDNVCIDLQKRFLVNLKSELNVLNGSLITIRGESHAFYHPSMFDFFVKYLSEDVAVYRTLLLKNINLNLLSLLKFQKLKNSYKIVTIGKNDVNNLLTGFLRIVDNPYASVYELNTILYWMGSQDVQVYFQLVHMAEFKEFKKLVGEKISTLPSSRLIDGNLFDLSDFFDLANLHSGSIRLDVECVKDVLVAHKSSPHFWRIVFKVTPFLSEAVVYDESYIGKDYLNQFYIDLRKEMMSLGDELFGPEFPDFAEVKLYERYVAEKLFDKARAVQHKKRSDYKQKTNKQWYPRYRVCNERMSMLKVGGPFGRKIYQLVMPQFEHLKALEKNQKERYIFNRMRKWWSD